MGWTIVKYNLSLCKTVSGHIKYLTFLKISSCFQNQFCQGYIKSWIFVPRISDHYSYTISLSILIAKHHDIGQCTQRKEDSCSWTRLDQYTLSVPYTWGNNSSNALVIVKYPVPSWNNAILIYWTNCLHS